MTKIKRPKSKRCERSRPLSLPKGNLGLEVKGLPSSGYPSQEPFIVDGRPLNRRYRRAVSRLSKKAQAPNHNPQGDDV